MKTLIKPLLNRNYRKFYLAQTISALGTRVYKVAITIHIFKLTGSALSVATMLLLTSIPAIFLGPFIGVIVDRYPKKKMIVILEILNGITTISLLLSSNIHLIYLIIFLTSLIGQVYRSTEKVIYTSILPSKDFLVGSSLLTVTRKTIQIFGPAIGALLISLSGFSLVIILNGVSYFISAVILITLNVPNLTQNRVKGEANKGGRKNPILDSIQYIRTSKLLTSVAFVNLMISFVAASSNAVMIVLVSETLGLGTDVYGYMTSVIGLGMLIGASIVPYINKKFELKDVLRGSLVILIVGFIGTGFTSNVVILMLCRMFVGIGNVLYSISSVTLLQKNTLKQYMGRTFSMINSMNSLSTVLGLVISGIIAEFYGPRVIFIYSSVIIAISIFVWRYAYQSEESVNTEYTTEKIS